jgi:type IX secretion system substrate protein
MNKFYTLTFFFPFFLSLAKADSWTQKANFGGPPTVFASAFSIGTKGYMGLGATPGYTSTFWEYDPATNIWTQKANFPGQPRAGAMSFSIDTLGYIGCGTTASVQFKDFYEYHPSTNTWIQKADFGGTPRFQGFGFSIGGRGYIGTGEYTITNYEVDFWEYDPVGDTWTQKANAGLLGRYRDMGFSIGNKGYMGCGQNITFNFVHDFWEYDPVTNAWTQKADFGGGDRYDGVGFSIGNYGYLGTGWNGPTQDWWQYDPATNTWTQKTDFGGVARGAASGFSTGSKGYLGIGGTGGPYLQDFWEYTPDSSTTAIDEPDHDSYRDGLKFEVYPNPASHYIIVSFQSTLHNKIELSITDVKGKKIYSQQLHPSLGGTSLPDKNLDSASLRKFQTKVNVSQFSKGLYFIIVNDACLPDKQGKENVVKKFLKE